jgi:hypothetical protein
MNIVGENFPKEIVEQINLRQTKLGSSHRDNELLSWMNSKTGWVRLVSSVDVNQEINPRKILDGLRGDGESALAKQYVLFGGVTKYTPNADLEMAATVTQRSGIARDGSVHNMGAYGLGGLDYGLSPMPGIVSANIKTENRGSLRTSTINIKAYNRKQFDIIDLLYLRLGYTVLLEWGHSMFYTNEGKLKTDVSGGATLESLFLTGKDKTGAPIDYNSLLPLIDIRRKQLFGNYDAVLGKVVNYSWTINKDLSYDITLTVRSIGDVIESLKMNTSLGNIKSDIKVDSADDTSGTKPENNAEALEAYAKKSTMGQHFYDLMKRLGSEEVSGTEANYGQIPWIKKKEHAFWWDTHPQNSIYYIRLGYLLDWIKQNLILQTQKNNVKTPIIKINTDPKTNIIHLEQRQIITDPTICVFKTTIVNPLLGITNTSLPTTLNETTGTELDDATSNVDNILNNRAFINEEGKLKDTNEISKLINNTYGKYNINSGGVVSFEGNVIKIINAQNEGDITTNEKFIQLSDVLNDPVISNFEQVRSFIKANITQPKAVTQAVQAAEEPLSYSVREMFLEGEFIENNNRYLYLMNVYFNMNWILSKIDSTIDSEGNIILLDFLQSLCDGFSEATCYYNKLTPTINENTEIIFIDEIGLPDRDAFLAKPDFKDKAVQTTGDGVNLAKFNMFGYKESGGQASFIRDFSMKTEIPASFATMITVGAQANGLVVGEDATCLSKMNYGLTDRMKPEIIDANIDSTVSGGQQLINNFYDSVIPITPTVIEFLKTVYGEQDLGNPDLIDSMKNIGKDLVKLNKTINSINQAIATTEDKSKNPYKSSPGNGFIPFNLQLTMDGLSGFKIYQKYTSEQEFLPTNYAESLDFIIKGITQNIENNQWTTVIESFGMPKNPIGSGYISPPTPPLTATSTNTGAARAPRDIAQQSVDGCMTKYPEFKFDDPRPRANILPYKDAVNYLKKKYGDDLGKAVFAVLFAEARKEGNAFVSAGGFNYAGVQTDSGRWSAPGIIGQYCRVDSGGVKRAFAIFASNESFLDFMASRIKAKGLSGINADIWTQNYINKWWSPAAKASYTKGTPTYNSKVAIFNSALKRYNNTA